LGVHSLSAHHHRFLAGQEVQGPIEMGALSTGV